MTPFERYVESGGNRRGFWRVPLGIALIGGFWIAGTAGVLTLWTLINSWRFGGVAPARGRLATILTGGDAETIAVMLLTFLGIWAGVFLTVRLLHRQKFATLFAPERRLRSGDLSKGLLLAITFTAVAVPVGIAVADAPRMVRPVLAWLPGAVLVSALVFVQATAEELIFRGYLLQQLALRSRNPFVWAVLPSAVFGSLHWSGTLPVEAGIMYVATTFMMGLALAMLVWRTGSLWASIGLHVGFNVIGLTLVGTSGVLSGTQLFLYPESDMMPLMRIDVFTTAALLFFVLGPWAPFGPPRARAET